MRPIASPQSSHLFPLNEVLGAESHVRILRVLAELGEPLSTTDIAKLAELTTPGARKALPGLVQTGIVQPSGEGRQKRYALHRDGPLASEILQLFASERRRSTDLRKELRQVDRQVSEPESTPGIRHHQGLDCRSTALSMALVRLIERDPSLVKRARLHIDQILEKQGAGDDDLEDWRDLLRSYSLLRLSQFLTASSERALRLRSSSPFFAVLSSNELEHLLAVAKTEA